jgi:hypothetical protein
VRPRIKCRTDPSSALALFFGFHRASGVNEREILATNAATRGNRKGSLYRSGRAPDWLKMKNPEAPAVKREAEEDWGRKRLA